jgi:hypothetical protein
MQMFRRMVVGVAAVLMLGSVAGWSQAGKTENSLSPELQQVRAAMEKYQNPVVAIHDGYLSTLGCVNFPNAAKPGHEPYPQGAMGIHFLNPALVGPKLDPMRPQVLLYEPDGGKLRLVGVEWFVPLATGVDKAPELFGQKFWGPMEGHHPLMPASVAHYDLHVWLFKNNPEGMFAPTNPAVKCSGYSYAMDMESTNIVSQTVQR